MCVTIWDLFITTAAAAGATLARQCTADGAPILLVTSDFTRAMDTARGLHVVLASSHGVAPAAVDVRLRERFFGDHNGLDHSRYQIVWAVDAVDMYHTTQGVERYMHVIRALLSF
jgi:broad specificity phosphatase PhoE